MSNIGEICMQNPFLPLFSLYLQVFDSLLWSLSPIVHAWGALDTLLLSLNSEEVPELLLNQDG